jgi:hypothetical protein
METNVSLEQHLRDVLHVEVQELQYIGRIQ